MAKNKPHDLSQAMWHELKILNYDRICFVLRRSNINMDKFPPMQFEGNRGQANGLYGHFRVVSPSTYTSLLNVILNFITQTSYSCFNFYQCKDKQFT